MIKKFPIFIQNKSLWKNLVNKYKVETLKQNPAYFVVDYLFTKLNIIIEIDSGMHIPITNYDKARDEYILCEYGISTARLYKYGSNYNDFYNLRNILNKRELFKQKLQLNNSIACINYDNIITKLFNCKYSRSIIVVDKIMEYYNNILVYNTPEHAPKYLTIDCKFFDNLTKDEIGCSLSILYWICGLTISIGDDIDSKSYICNK